jgi:hypothetical protein
MPDPKIDKWVGYRDITFLQDPKDATKQDDLLQLCVVGTDGK